MREATEAEKRTAYVLGKTEGEIVFIHDVLKRHMAQFGEMEKASVDPTETP